MKNDAPTTTPESPPGIRFPVEIRDYFAAAALTALAHNLFPHSIVAEMTAVERAFYRQRREQGVEIAYELADQMLAARGKEGA